MRDGDDEIAAALPKAPPHSPARRTAAIEEAMRRFDGGEPTSAAGRHRPEPHSAPWWGALRRPQFAGLVSAAMVAVIGMPVAWYAIDRESTPSLYEPGSEGAETAQQDRTRTPVKGVLAPLPAGSQAVQPPSMTRAAPSAPQAPVLIDGKRTSAADTGASADDSAKDVVVTGTNIRGVAPTGTNLTVVSKEDIAASGQSSTGQLLATIPGFNNFNGLPNNAEAAAKGAAAAKPNLRGTPDRQAAAKAQPPMSNAPRAPAPPPPPPPPAPRAMAREESAATADAKRQAERGRVGAASVRGDWNACTVNDPNENLGACKALVDPAATGTAGRAAAHVANGLTRAWQGDFAGAIVAFDEAISLSPRLAFAWLNRGLALQRRGDLDRALADLDQAVRYDPNAASGYFSRSVVLRQRGDTRRAAADEQRAVELDPRYEVLFR